MGRVAARLRSFRVFRAIRGSLTSTFVSKKRAQIAKLPGFCTSRSQIMLTRLRLRQSNRAKQIVLHPKTRFRSFCDKTSHDIYRKTLRAKRRS